PVASRRAARARVALDPRARRFQSPDPRQRARLRGGGGARRGGCPERSGRSWTVNRPRILLVAGARPNFMKIAPILEAFRREPEIPALLVHTGQHYDEAMSRSFFEDLDLPRPDVDLEVGSGT